MARLTVSEGAGAGGEFVLPAYAVVIGRDEGCDFVLDDQRASRQHACIRFHADAWQLRDLGSANGTFLDGERVGDWVGLGPGSEIRIGRTILRFEDDRAAAIESAPVSRPAYPSFPGYEVTGIAGRGATGVVYRAQQSGLDRAVAIKVLDPRLAAQPETVERFVGEARAAASLPHPNVVQVIEVGQRGALHWFSMEFMEGGTVEDALLAAPGSRLPWRESVRIVAAAAKGLAHLHANGLVHRDVKPANLLLDARRDVKLGDLGTIVRADDADAERIGTPHYMSPEQAKRLPVSRASDVYSLGATLYRMLTGRTPHHGRDPREVILSVANDDPPPVERGCPEAPAELAALVRSMMARAPAARPVDAAELGRRLEETLREVKESAASRRRLRRVRASATGWILALAVVGAFAWAFTHPDDLRTLLRLGPTVSPTGAPAGGPSSGETSSKRTSSDETPRASSKPPDELASETFAEIQARERGLAGPSLANAAQWRVLAADYARLAEVFPLDSEWVVRGHWRSREIRDDLVRVTGGDGANAAFAERWVDRALRENVGSTVRTEPLPFVPPEELPESGGADDPPGEGPVGASGIGGSAAGAPASATLADVIAARDAVRTRADALVATGDVQTALDTMLAWVRAARLDAAARHAPGEVHEAIAEGVTWTRRTARNESARLEGDLERDRMLLRAHLPRTALFRDGTPAQSPAQALARIDALDPLLVTRLGHVLVAGRRARVAAIAVVWPAGADLPPSLVDDVLRTAAAPSSRAGVREGALWLAIEAGRVEPAAGLLATGAATDEATRASAAAEIAALRALVDAPGNGAGDGAHAPLLRPARAGAAPVPVFAAGDVEHWFETWGGTHRGTK